MPITIHPELEATGISIETYIERIAREERVAEDELEALALEGLNSGDPIEIEPGYWEEKHRRLEERLKQTGKR